MVNDTWEDTKLEGKVAGSVAVYGLKELSFIPLRMIRGLWRATKFLGKNFFKALKSDIEGKGGGGSFKEYWEEAKREFHLKKEEYGGFWRMVFDAPKKKGEK